MADSTPGRCVVLLSGGLDSAVTLAGAVAEGFEAHALTICYGQRHQVEVDASRRVAAALGAKEHRVIELGLDGFGGSSLVGAGPVPKGARGPGDDPIPSTYVPARNTVFLSLALAWAEALGARAIFTGVSAVDYSGYPDCRPAFIEAFQRTANLGTRAADGGDQFRIRTPLIRLTKGQTVELGLELGVDFALTWSCYDPAPGPAPCGECEACQLRARGFADAGVADPLLEGGRRGD